MKHLLIFVLFFSVAVQAAMVLPPEDIQTPAGQRAFAKQILKDMPMLPSQNYTLQTVSEYVQKMSELLYRNGLLQDKQFQEWVAERPDLQTYSFFSYYDEKKDIYSLSEEYAGIAQGYYSEHLASRYRRNKKGITAYLVARISELALATNTLQSNAVSAGLGSLFDQNQRREILGQKNIIARAESLRSALGDVSEDELRARFQSERFGIPREQLNKERALQLLDASVAQEVELIHLLSILEVLERSGKLAPEVFTGEYIQWMTSEEPREFNSLTEAGDAVTSAIGRVRSIARNSFTTLEAGANRQVRDNEIIVQEVPPHLAVFRSCPGGDCSTGSSWAFPFSPKERNFYIFHPDNLFEEIGYISGNVLKVDGKDTLYIRDMTGRKLSPDQIDLIIKGFAQIYREYGVEQLAFAVPAFHNAENHFQPLYSRIEAMIKDLPIHSTSFTDADIRTNYLYQVASGHYDSPERHAKASLYVEGKLSPGSPAVAAERLSDTFVYDGRNELSAGEGLLRRLELALTSNNPVFLEGTDYKFDKWPAVYNIWMNSKNWKLDTYHQYINAELEKFGFTTTPALRRKFPELFYAGTIAAKDAFSHSDENVRHRNFEMVLNRFLRFGDENILYILQDHKENFFKYPPFLKAVTQMLERGRPADYAKITSLWNHEYFFEGMKLSKPILTHLTQTTNAYNAVPVAKLIALAYDLEYTDIFTNHNIYYYALQVIGRHNNRTWYPNTHTDSELARKVALYFAYNDMSQLNLMRAMYDNYRFIAVGDSRPFFRVAFTVAYLRAPNRAISENQFAKFEETLSANLENQELPEELRALARKALRDLRKKGCEGAATSKKKPKPGTGRAA